jgi:hypothetical protein
MSNANCAYCGAEIMIRGDGTHPMRRVPGQPRPRYFCDAKCCREWEAAHCSYCGATPRTALLTVRVAGGSSGQEPCYCNVACLQAGATRTDGIQFPKPLIPSHL